MWRSDGCIYPVLAADRRRPVTIQDRSQIVVAISEHPGLQVESLRVDIAERASERSLAPEMTCLVSAALQGSTANPKTLQESLWRETCRSAPSRSQEGMQTSLKGSDPYCRVRGSLSTRHRGGRRRCTVAFPPTSFPTISTTSSVVARLVRVSTS